MGAKRDRLSLIYEILKLIANRRIIAKTNLQKKIGISTTMYTEHIDNFLIKNGFVIRDEKGLFIVTDKGYEYIASYENLLKNFDMKVM